MWREGSEEFFIDIGEKLTKKDIRRLHDFHDEVSRQIRIDGAPLTLSIGIGHGKGLDEKGQERLLSDRVVYLAKNDGRNKIALHRFTVDKNEKNKYYEGEDQGVKKYVTEHSRKQIKEAATALLQSGNIDPGTFERIVEGIDRGETAQEAGGRGVPERSGSGKTEVAPSPSEKQQSGPEK